MKRARIIAAGGLVVAFVELSVLAILQNQELRHKDRTELTRTIESLEADLALAKAGIPTGKHFGLVYVKVDGEKVPPATGVITEWGFRLDSSCREVWPGAKLEILERSAMKGCYGDDAPVKFRVTLGERSVEFEGVAYKSATGEITAEYIAGEFGQIRARHRRRGIYLSDRASIAALFELLGISCEFREDSMELWSR